MESVKSLALEKGCPKVLFIPRWTSVHMTTVNLASAFDAPSWFCSGKDPVCNNYYGVSMVKMSRGLNVGNS